MELHERVRYLRKEILNMSQTEFAEILGTKRDVINNIEGDRLKRPEQKEPLFNLMCQKFGVSEDWLKHGIGEPNILNEDEEAGYVSELLEDTDNDLYDLIKAIMKTYCEASESDKLILKSFAKNLKSNLDK